LIRISKESKDSQIQGGYHIIDENTFDEIDLVYYFAFKERQEPLLVMQREGKALVSNSDLFRYLDGGTSIRCHLRCFSRRIERYSLVEGKDYVLDFYEFNFCNNPKFFMDFTLTIETAKFIAALERSKSGRIVYQFLTEKGKEFNNHKL